jgi:ribosome-associated translation inhibitor RaiA
MTTTATHTRYYLQVGAASHERPHNRNLFTKGEYGASFVAEITRDHADFILKAVNSHDELLAACKAAADYIEMLERHQAKGISTTRDELADLRAAIQKAEAQQ